MYVAIKPSDFETDKITYSIMITQNIIGILSDVSAQSTLDKDNKEELFRFTIDNEDVTMTVYPTVNACLIPQRL